MCGSRRGLVALGATLCALASLTGSAEACVDVWSAKKCSKKANKGFCDALSNRCSKEKNANKCKKTAKKCQSTCGQCSPPSPPPPPPIAPGEQTVDALVFETELKGILNASTTGVFRQGLV